MFSIRRAGPEDIAVIARHRAMMFKDMGILADAAFGEMLAETERGLARMIPAGEYQGWLATAEGRVVGGAGVQLRQTLPFPLGSEVYQGRQALVINVYTEPEWRRRGVARRLMEAVLAWTREEQIRSVVLHASDDGRELYERLGFVATNEMRHQDNG